MKTNTLDFDAQALRERILDLAMRGKLVPQDPEDEPASVLLEKIKAEKEELIKEKKIKKSKPLPEITDDEKPFDIPDSWEWVRLGDVIKPEVHKKPYQNFVYIDIASIDNRVQEIIHPTQVNIEKDKVASRARQVLEANDILFSVVRPYLKNIAMVPNNKDYKVGSTGFYVLKPFKLINRKYIFYLVLSKYTIQKMTRKMKGDNSPSIRKGDLQELIIPLPPLSEQSRIAAKIAQLFALLRKVESSTQQYAELQTLLKSKVLDLAMQGKLVKQDPADEPASVLLEKIKAEKAELVKEKKIKKSKPLPLITDDEKPFDIPDSWEWVRLGDIIDLSSGKQLTRKKMNNDFKYPVFGANGKIGYFKKYNNDSRRILIGRVGSVGVINIAPEKTWITDNALIVKINTPKFLSFEWLKYLLKDIHLEKLASRTSQPVISATKVKNKIIPLPPLSEQEKIAEKLKSIYGY